VPGVEETKQVMQDRAELHEIERQAFRDISSVGILPAWSAFLKRESEQPALGKPAVEREASAAPLMSMGGQAVEAVADLAGKFIEMLADMISPTPITPERVQASVDAKERREEIDLARFRSDADYRRQVEAGEAAKIQQEQRRYYDQQRERDEGRQR
jgi:hypothetical protein